MINIFSIFYFFFAQLIWTFEFNIQERGKVRHIRSVKIEERVVQRCLCDNALTPMLGRRLIYDNGASTKGKGYTFTVNRLTKSLHQYYRKYGHVGYILLFDFSKFFDTLEHWLLHQIIKETFEDERLIKLSCYFIDMFGEKGIGLGSQISQNMALSSASKLDHYIKEVLRIKGYARYMDDGYLIHHSKEYLHKCLFHIKKICNELGIILNEKKTHISRLDKGFTYIKIRFYLTPTGKIIKKIEPNSVTRMRRKLKKFAIFVKEGKMSKFDVYQSLQSWISHAEKFNAYRTIRSMVNLYYKLFGDEYVYKNYKKLTDSGCNEKRKSGVCKTEPKKQGNNNL